MEESFTLVIDGMGGDFAPQEVVKGAVLAAEENPSCKLILVGQSDVLEKELSSYPSLPNIEIYPAAERIEMGEEPVQAIRTKKNSSIVVGLKLVKEGKADGFISAGNTGAVMGAALLVLGRAGKVLRPAIAIIVPVPEAPVVLLDAGANVDCKAKNLFQFAQMGALYASSVLGVKNPRIGLLNIGEEEGKGGVLVQKTYRLLRELPYKFVGNVEGKDIFSGKADVIVTDGFTGNVVLKVAEGASEFFFNEIKGLMKKSFKAKLGGFLLRSALKDFKRRMDYQEYGGAQLLGVRGVCIISHGSSKAKAIKNAVGVGIRELKHKLIEEIEKAVT